ncbi:MAG: aldo/keto reductase [Acidobacteriota bacterium]|nr:aldo/keto reductase [Acidobacteriota bacterium]
MRYRTFGRTGWDIAEIGYGMWGMGGWTGSDDQQSLRALARSVELGCNFFDTAWAYGQGRSERLLGETLRAFPDRRLYIASKVPPATFKWPARAGDRLDDVFPPGHIREYTEASLKHLGVETLDLQQLHVWNDEWAGDERWQREVDDLKREGLIRAFGISVNRWEPANVLQALATGIVDAVQVVYNIFDQAPEDALLPECRRRNIAVIARVPFDEGSLTGQLTADSRWAEGDWRNVYFAPPHLAEVLERVERLGHLVPEGMDLPELALRFILANPDVTTTIPGMRRPLHVERNLSASDGAPLPPRLRDALRAHRWDRTMVIM